MNNENNFAKGSIYLPLLKFSVPILLALILQSAYGMADLLIVGRFGSAADVSAVSNGSGIMQTVQSVIIGISMGTTVLMGIRIGQDKPEECGKVVEASIWLFGIMGTVMALAMVFLAGPISSLMQVPEEAFTQCVYYVRICGVGLLFITAYNVLSGIMRGIGNSQLPMITVGIACVINILGDLLLVGVFKLQAAGAAIATVSAQGISVLISILLLKKGGLPFTIKMRSLKNYFSDIVSVIKIGMPIALQSLLVSLSFRIIGIIVNELGVVVSAGVGVAEKLCMIIMLAPDAFSQAMSTVVSQNMGASNPQRARKFLLYGMLSSFAIGVVMAYIAFFHGQLLSGIFTADPDVCYASAEFLKGYAIDTLITSFMFCFVGYFNGCGKTTFVMLEGTLSAFGIRVPVAFLMSRITPVSVFKLSLATPCSSIAQLIACLIYFRILLNKEKKNSIQI